MADNQKYYYMRLKENFFDTESMIVLESMPDGHLYSNILLKLYLRSLKNEGRLMFNDRIPYNTTILAQITRHSVGVVEKALEIFKQLELVEILDNGAIYLLDIQEYIGKTSTEADRKRSYRNRIAQEKGIAITDNRQMSDKCPDKSTPELEIELEIEKEINNNISFQKQVFGYWVDKSLNNSALTKHTKLTKDMDNALKSIKKLYSVDKCKELIDRFCTVFEEKKNTDYPLKKRTLQEFFGQKAYQSKSLICQEFDDEGCKWINHKEDEPIDYFEMVKKAEEARRNG